MILWDSCKDHSGNGPANEKQITLYLCLSLAEVTCKMIIDFIYSFHSLPLRYYGDAA